MGTTARLVWMVIGVIAIVFISAGLMAILLTTRDRDAVIFLAAVGVALIGLIGGPIICTAKDMAYDLPPDALDRVLMQPREVILERLGNPIPVDAIDRRWIKAIEEELNGYHTYTWQPTDPIEMARYESDHAARRQKIFDLLRAAKRARGVRLPPAPATMIDD